MYIHIYIYVCIYIVQYLVQKLSFLSQYLVQVLCFLLSLFLIFLLVCWENEILKANAPNFVLKWSKSQVNIWSKMLGPDIDPTLDQILTQFYGQFLFFVLLKPVLYSVFSQKRCISHPKIRNTICEHNYADWRTALFFFSVFFFFFWGGGGVVVSFYLSTCFC